MQNDIGVKNEFETRELGNFLISVKISYPHFFNLMIKYILTFARKYVYERTFSYFSILKIKK